MTSSLFVSQLQLEVFHAPFVYRVSVNPTTFREEPFIEDMLMLILEKSPDQKKLEAECTIIIEPDGVRLILRDSGVVFDITDEDALADSFRRYVVANLMAHLKTKAYITTIGYNRNELFFPESVTGAAS